MLSRKSKKLFYRMAGPLMAANAIAYRRFRAPRQGTVKVQLGPGQRNYLPGWTNVDANIFTGKADLWADLRRPLPFLDASVDCFYSHHVVEHLPDLRKHFSEIFRCLKGHGAYRVGGPNGDLAIRKFLEGDSSWFSDFPEARRSLGGRLENFIFCRGEHLTILTFSFLEELLIDAGFVNIQRCIPTESRLPRYFNECLSLEGDSDFSAPHTLIVEAEKP